MSSYVLFLARVKRKGRPFLEGTKRGKGSNILILPQRSIADQCMEFYDKFVDRLQDLPKLKNPAVSKEKV